MLIECGYYDYCSVIFNCSQWLWGKLTDMIFTFHEHENLSAEIGLRGKLLFWHAGVFGVMNPHRTTVLHNVLYIYLEDFHTDLQTKEWMDILITSIVYSTFKFLLTKMNDSLIEKAIILFEKHKSFS